MQKHKPVPYYIYFITALCKIQRSTLWLLGAGVELQHRKSLVL